MTDTEREWDESRIDWNHLGRAAERFARRVAHDAGRFAERIQEHTGEFAEEISRDWRRGRGKLHDGAEVRHIFEDLRGMLTDIIDGVDELIAHVFQEPAAGADTPWVRMVTNRDLVCAACERPLKAGDEAYIRRNEAGIEARCLACGTPAEEAGERSEE